MHYRNSESWKANTYNHSHHEHKDILKCFLHPPLLYMIYELYYENETRHVEYWVYIFKYNLSYPQYVNNDKYYNVIF